MTDLLSVFGQKKKKMEKEKKPEQTKQQREIFVIDRNCKNEAISVHRPSFKAAPVSLCHLLRLLSRNLSAVSLN